MDQVASVRNKTDIVALISSYIQLKKAGRNFKANCPFHGEKTPSFVISPERQIWHCFGCGKGGDVFTFLMEYEKMEFPEALRTLAEKAGITLEYQKFDKGLSSKKETIYKVNHLAEEFYHYLLTKHQIGKKAYEYLTIKRKIKPETVNTFQLGFAPFTGNALITYLSKKKGFNQEDLIEAGLATKRGNSLYDFFQGRIIFPLFDHRGNSIGFAGRVFIDEENTSKYVNTRETLAYHKGSTFFGLNTAKETIKKTNQAILMEGEIDVISSFQEGITNVVAVKGTALTEDQINLLSRFAKKVTLCFDMDNAGEAALKRSVNLLEKKGLTISVIEIPGKDADEAIQKDPISFKKSVKNDIEVYDFLLEKEKQKYNLNSAEGKKNMSDSMLPFLGNIENEIIKEHYLKILAGLLGSSIEALNSEIEKKRKKEVVSEIPQIKKLRTREEVLEEYLLALLIQQEDVKSVLENNEKFFSEYTFENVSFGKIIEYLLKYAKAHDTVRGEDIAKLLPMELLPSFDACFLLPLPLFEDKEKHKEEIEKTMEELIELSLKKKIKSLSLEIGQKEKEGRDEDILVLQKNLSELLKNLKTS